MLFSDDQVAKVLNDRFECSWESVRPVPRCEIDFGDGRKLTRTLAGNVATYFCTSEGEAFEIVPGVVTRDEFLSRVQVALSFHGTLAPLGETARREAVREYHRAVKGHEGDDQPRLERIADGVRMRPDMSKRVVEQPIKDALHAAGDMIAAEARTRQPGEDFHCKRAVERPVKTALHEDTDTNRRKRAPLVHALLAELPLAAPSKLTKRVYREILEVDLDDPYLGLAPYVLGGEPGRHGP